MVLLKTMTLAQLGGFMEAFTDNLEMKIRAMEKK